MNQFVCLLRGINVSGKNSIKMGALKEVFELLGFTSVYTYIQSGNVVFTSKNDNRLQLETMISAKITEIFQLNIAVFVFGKNGFNVIVSENFFLKNINIDTKKLHVTFMSQSPESTAIAELMAINFGSDEFKIVQNIIYLYCSNGYGNTKLTNTFFEKKLKVNCTTRNWNTTLKLGGMVNNIF